MSKKESTWKVVPVVPLLIRLIASLGIGITAAVLAPSQRMSIERKPRGSRSGVEMEGLDPDSGEHRRSSNPVSPFFSLGRVAVHAVLRSS